MRIRWVAFAVLAVAGLTAFAPAPFVKPDRDRASKGDVLAGLQGTWSVTDKQRMGPNGQLSKYSTSQKIRIEKDSWRNVLASEVKGKVPPKGLTKLSYKIVLSATSRPTEFRLKRTTGSELDYMIGIIEVRGDTARVLYRLGSSSFGEGQAKPQGFDTVPEGWYLMTLRRDP